MGTVARGERAGSWTHSVVVLVVAALLAVGLVGHNPALAQQNPKVEVREQTLVDRTAAPDAERWLAIWAGAPGALDRTESNPTWLHHWQSLTRVSWGSVPARPLPDRHPLGQVVPQWLQLGGGPLAAPRAVAAGIGRPVCVQRQHREAASNSFIGQQFWPMTSAEWRYWPT